MLRFERVHKKHRHQGHIAMYVKYWEANKIHFGKMNPLFGL